MCYIIKLISPILLSVFLIGSAHGSLFGGDSEKGGNAANGAKGWVDNCSRCHNYRPGDEFSPKNWQTIMQHMRIQAGLTGQEARDIYAFLAEEASQ